MKVEVIALLLYEAAFLLAGWSIKWCQNMIIDQIQIIFVYTRNKLEFKQKI